MRSIRHEIALLAALCLCACNGLSTFNDGGSGGGIGSGGGEGGSGGGVGGGTGGSGGGVGGGGTGGSGGGSGGAGGGGAIDAGPPVYRGDGGALTFVSVVHPIVKIYLSVHGLAGSEVYVGGAEGTILRCTTGATPTCSTAMSDMTFGAVDSIWRAPNGNVFATSVNGLATCLSNCGSASSWTTTSPSNTEMAAVCGAPDGTPYAVGLDLLAGGQDTSVWKFSGTWSKVGTITGTGRAYGCAVVGNALLVSATTDVGRWTLPAGPAAIETVDYAGLGSGTGQRWFGINAAIGLTTIGGDSHWVAERQDDAGWAVVFHPLTGGVGPLRAIAGRFAIEQFGSGDVVQLGMQAVKRQPGDAGWAYIADFGDLDVYGLWAEDDNTYWMVGVDNPNGTGTGVIFRARR